MSANPMQFSTIAHGQNLVFEVEPEIYPGMTGAYRRWRAVLSVGWLSNLELMLFASEGGVPGLDQIKYASSVLGKIEHSRVELLALIIQFYNQQRESGLHWAKFGFGFGYDWPEITNPEEIGRLLSHPSLMVDPGFDGSGEMTAVLAFNCEWDLEHLVEVRFSERLEFSI